MYVTPSMVSTIVFYLDPHKARETDLILVIILKKCGSELIPALSKLYNKLAFLPVGNLPMLIQF